MLKQFGTNSQKHSPIIEEQLRTVLRLLNESGDRIQAAASRDWDNDSELSHAWLSTYAYSDQAHDKAKFDSLYKLIIELDRLKIGVDALKNNFFGFEECDNFLKMIPHLQSVAAGDITKLRDNVKTLAVTFDLVDDDNDDQYHQPHTITSILKCFELFSSLMTPGVFNLIFHRYNTLATIINAEENISDLSAADQLVGYYFADISRGVTILKTAKLINTTRNGIKNLNIFLKLGGGYPFNTVNEVVEMLSLLEKHDLLNDKIGEANFIRLQGIDASLKNIQSPQAYKEIRALSNKLPDLLNHIKNSLVDDHKNKQLKKQACFNEYCHAVEKVFTLQSTVAAIYVDIANGSKDEKCPQDALSASSHIVDQQKTAPTALSTTVSQQQEQSKKDPVSRIMATNLFSPKKPKPTTTNDEKQSNCCGCRIG